MSYVMWEVKVQWRKVEACAVKERGNVQAEAEGTCSIVRSVCALGLEQAQHPPLVV